MRPNVHLSSHPLAHTPRAGTRLAWFSPLPPSTSGIAAYSAELLPLLHARGHAIDTFSEESALDFVWQHRRNRYALTVFQLGNAACHDYMWAYLFRYPGLVVLHDAQLHQSRALSLTRRMYPRPDDYRSEFRANHPDAPADVAELVAAGLGDAVYHHWPMIRLVLDSARLTLVHNVRLLARLREQYPRAALDAIEMGVRDPLADLRPTAAADVRARLGLSRDAIVVAAFGGITPEKRIPQLLEAVAAIAPRHPHLHLVLVGAEAGHYDVRADAARHRITDRVHITGYVRDDELSAYLAAADVCSCLRWPTNRETSASWLRCLGAARPTIVTALAHLLDVPTIALAIDVLDEAEALPQALDRLVGDASLRAQLGQAARAWWEQHHQLDAMADGYDRAIARAIEMPTPQVRLPDHLLADGTAHARALGAELGVTAVIDEALGR